MLVKDETCRLREGSPALSTLLVEWSLYFASNSCMLNNTKKQQRLQFMSL